MMSLASGDPGAVLVSQPDLSQAARQHAIVDLLEVHLPALDVGSGRRPGRETGKRQKTC